LRTGDKRDYSNATGITTSTIVVSAVIKNRNDAIYQRVQPWHIQKDMETHMIKAFSKECLAWRKKPITRNAPINEDMV